MYRWARKLKNEKRLLKCCFPFSLCAFIMILQTLRRPVHVLTICLKPPSHALFDFSLREGFKRYNCNGETTQAHKRANVGGLLKDQGKYRMPQNSRVVVNSDVLLGFERIKGERKFTRAVPAIFVIVNSSYF